MGIKKCEHSNTGHYYDSDIHVTCPYCKVYDPDVCVHGIHVRETCVTCRRIFKDEIGTTGLTGTPLPPYKDVDPISWPAHYNQGSVECIDAMRSAFGDEAVENYCIVNAFKYVWRYQQKNGREDLKKAIWYLRFATGDDPRGDER